jgi:hypothetical protein
MGGFDRIGRVDAVVFLSSRSIAAVSVAEGENSVYRLPLIFVFLRAVLFGIGTT